MFPHARRVWSKRGHQPVVRSNRTYEWLYLFAFICPKNGEVFWLTLPTVSTEAFEISLFHFAKQLNLGAKRRVLLVIDGAGFHKGQTLKIPEGVHLKFLPAYSPELQPVEQLWPLTHEAHANRLFDSLDHLEEVLLQRCRWLQKNQSVIKGRVKFHWWPDD